MRIVLAILLALVYLTLGCPDWLSGGEVPFITRSLTYHFFHANIFHLLANILSLLLIFNPRRKTNFRDFATAYVIASLLYCCALRPVVGISNILFAVSGMRTPPLSSKWWRSGSTLVFLGITAGMGFLPQFSAITHILCFISGVLVAHIRRHQDLNNGTGGAYGK